MLDRVKGAIFFECDSCGETLETDTSDFNEAKRMLDTSEWRVRKIGPEWIHSCPDCVEGR